MESFGRTWMPLEALWKCLGGAVDVEDALYQFFIALWRLQDRILESKITKKPAPDDFIKFSRRLSDLSFDF